LRHPRDDYDKNGRGMWPQCGREPAFRPLMRDACALHTRRGIRVEIAWSAGLILGSKALTRPAPQDYIDPLGRAAAWRDGASAKPLTVSHGDRASGHALCGHVRSPRRMWRALCSSALALLPLPKFSGRRSCEAPGCLKSESEERETWTAESLRAASSNGEGLGLFQESSGHGRDFGGLTFQGFLHCPIAQAIGRVGTSSNVVTSREKVLSNLRV
jgi:hypothetical protein